VILEKGQRALVAFSLRLRIGPQARSRAKVKTETTVSAYDRLAMEMQMEERQ
jgi:hypothetical protein